MIKFFRSIRSKSISQSRFGKYLLYALGEIILVVIGILIALQINNWNEGKIERKTEKEYLENMLEDLRSDMQKYEAFEKGNQIIFQLPDSIFTNITFNGGAGKEAELAFWSRRITMDWVTIEPVTRTFEQMKSSGHLRLIRNKDVSNQISTYYSTLTQFDSYQEAGMLWAEDYVDFMGKIFNAEVLRSIVQTRKQPPEGTKAMISNDSSTVNGFLNSLQYFNGALILGQEVINEKKSQAKNLVDLISKTYLLND
ncbi:MAG: DUF6090 family protein [Flavobacteriaceae bacterium]|nr:DUF6090 family protein [Flavobacteriaceae bacterium]